MPRFQIVMPHDPSRCVEALEEVLAYDPEFHSQVFYGCHFGDDTGYALIEASGEEEARSGIPKTLRGRARVVEVEHVSPEEIRASHDRAT
jgi:hypothetical protein